MSGMGLELFRSTLALACPASLGRGPTVSLVELIPDMADTLSPLRDRDLQKKRHNICLFCISSVLAI